jgi:exopolysaccharide biosynthesis polyprenyl glycosylphosphotransferase
MRATGDMLTADFRPSPVTANSPTLTSWMSAYRYRLGAVDCMCAVTGAVFALRIRFGLAGHAARPAEYVAFTCMLPLLWTCALLLTGGYDRRHVGLGPDEFRRVLKAATTLTVLLAIISYGARLDVARGYIAVALPTTLMLDLAGRFLLRKHLHRRRSRGACVRRVIAVGHGAAVSEFVSSLRRDSNHGLRVIAACLPEANNAAEVAGIPVAGALDSVASVVMRLGADTVAVLACQEIDGLRLRELAWALEKTSTELYVAPALMDVAGPRTTIKPIAGLPLLHVDHAEISGGKQVVKAVADRVLAGIALMVLVPLFVIISVAIRRTDPGPVFFRQIRVGKAGRPFVLFKFRTMVVDAEQQRALLAAENEADGALFKIRKDPRITRTGAWLRRWSLDGLPQLLNVVRGEMSLVGPRPALPEETERYGYHMRRRLAVKPGITGLWQVSGRSDLAWNEAVRLDVRYVENWSFALDAEILLKTGLAVLHGSGAY